MRQRSADKELLDAPGIPREDIQQNMQELRTINKWLGGHSVTLAGLKALRKNKQRISICEIGCGGGDNLAALARWCRKKDLAVTITGIDINPFCIQSAKEAWEKDQTLNGIPVHFICSDYRLVCFTELPDIIFSSLFCHHFTNEELAQQLRWMQSNCRGGFFINDLHRHPFALYAISLLTRLFSRSYLVKHDAPLSVKRSFVKSDWLQILQEAGIATFSLEWKWAFRWLVVVG